MTVRLRPHHLLCILTYVGRGYSPAFTANMTLIAERLAAGEAIEIVEGPDDICAPLLDEPEPHCHRPEIIDRDLRAADDLSRLVGLPVLAGSRFSLGQDQLRRLRAAMADGQARSACGGCEWNGLCGSVIASGYDGTIL